MPLYNFVIMLIITAFVWACSIWFFWMSSSKGDLVRTVLIVILLVGTIAAFSIAIWYYNSTAAGRRAWKTQESNFNNGITREVKVYSMDGKLLEEYEGKFDLEYDNDRILFDDEYGMRHIIYCHTGIVVIDEVS